MVDKIGWTEPLDSERGALEIVMVPSYGRALLVAAVDGWRQRVGMVTGREGGSVDEITMTEPHSRVKGGGRHECARGGARGRRTGALRGESIRVLTRAAKAVHARSVRRSGR